MFRVFLDTFQESFRNWMFLFFFVASSLVIGVIALALNMDVVNGVMAGVSIMGNPLEVRAETVTEFIEDIQTGIAMMISTIGLVLALMATAMLFHTMLQKGSIELLLCRPVPRWKILTGRFLGGAAIMAFNALYLIIGVWLVLGSKSGVWTAGFPLSTTLVVFAFLVLFSVLMMVSVITENGPAGLLVAWMLLAFSPILAAHSEITPVFSRELYRDIFRSIYWVLPKPAETIAAAARWIQDRPLDIGMVVGTSAAFALACYLITMAYFTRKDY
jgi:ABC-type transport system involved in multi-copper enzyme maturation permease subunit